MFQWITKILPRKKSFVCGGEGCIEFADSNKKTIGKIWYRKPTSDMILDYTYQSLNGLSSESNLRELESSKKKEKTCHEIMIRDLCIPFAGKVYLRCEGFVTEDKKPLEQLERDEQLAYLIKWQSHMVVQMVMIAFAVDSVVKKKS
jgi:hypothetical protein